MKFDKAIAMFLPLESSDALFTAPLNPMAKQVTDKLPHNSNTMLIAMSLVFVVVYYFVARWRMQKADL